jgi:hypothetical protein
MWLKAIDTNSKLLYITKYKAISYIFEFLRRRKMKKVLVLLACVVCMGLMFTGCGGNGAGALVGTWVLEDGQPFYGVIEDYRLSKDGKGITDIQNAITWKVENGRFVIAYESSSTKHELDYKVQGKKLIISFGGKDHTYINSSGNSDDLKKWRSSIEIDPVNDEKRIFFRVVSSEGNRRLYIRQYGENSPEMYIYWGGEIEDSLPEVSFRIDNREAESKKWNRSDTRDSTFYPYPTWLQEVKEVKEVIENLLDAKQVVARCTSGGRGTMTAIFDVTGFKDIVAKYNDDLKWF